MAEAGAHHRIAVTSPYDVAMSAEAGPAGSLDDQDRISILQLLTLSPTERLQYLLDENAFDEALEAAPADE
jgi:hypothetical protein